jgi:hypothetical protein
MATVVYKEGDNVVLKGLDVKNFVDENSVLPLIYDKTLSNSSKGWYILGGQAEDKFLIVSPNSDHTTEYITLEENINRKFIGVTQEAKLAGEK